MSRPVDEQWMLRALELARLGEGLTRPNPPVGAVLIDRKGRLLGEAYHKKAGDLHAEAQLLRDAGARAKGATLYTTLEPCSTVGRTPACTDAVLASNVRRVVSGCLDPNPKHAGAGHRILRKHGVAVVEGVCEPDATALIEPFSKWVTTGVPMVTLKLGISLDGKIADARGRSRWITGKAAREAVQAWRRRADAILVGSGTARIDNPSLQPRPARRRRPLRVVVSTKCHLPSALTMFHDRAVGRTLVMTTKRASAASRRRIERTGAEVVVVRERAGQPSMQAVMKELGRRGLLHVFCEGGGEVAESLLKQQLVDQCLFFVSPVILGGKAAHPAIGGTGWSLAGAPRLDIQSVERCGEDLVIVTRPGTGEHALHGGNAPNPGSAGPKKKSKK
jgi:diaminohydroxyphosphoribosylaminopyrimidine deaminase/5-amino-6-(5-phosphoribosylamino)uracil reductase